MVVLPLMSGVLSSYRCVEHCIMRLYNMSYSPFLGKDLEVM